MTIYELDEEIGKILDELDDFIESDGDVINTETGEVLTIDAYMELQARLDQLAEKRDEKISNIACWIKQLKADSEAIKKEKLNLEKRQKYCDNKVESLKQYLMYALNGEKFKDSRVNISYRSSKKVSYTSDFDVNKLPDEFKRIKIEPKATELKEAIESGQTFEGVEVVNNTNIQIK